MNNTKEKKAKLQITIAVLVLTVILFAEMYLMINFPKGYIPIILLGVVALVAVYVVINAIMTINAEKEAARNEHFENLYRSEKASYIMLKKSFDEIDERLSELQETSKVPAEEIINAQKGIAKVIINRSKENADAIINSNDQVLERLDEVEETQNIKFTSLSKEQRLKLTDIGTQTDMKLQDVLMQLKDTELRLNQAIMSGSKVVMQAPPTYVAAPVMTEPVMTESVEVETPEVQIPEMEFFETEPVEEPVVEEELSVEDLLSTADDLLAGDIFLEEPETEVASLFEETSLLPEEPVVEMQVEEKPPMPDLSDPNKQMSPDDIAALFANMAVPDAPAEETAQVEEEIAAVEEKPPMPDLSDPNKVMSPEEIAALIANL